MNPFTNTFDFLSDAILGYWTSEYDLKLTPYTWSVRVITNSNIAHKPYHIVHLFGKESVDIWT